MTWKSIEPSKDVSFRRCVPRFVKDEDVITSPRNGCITFFLFFFTWLTFSFFHFTGKVMACKVMACKVMACKVMAKCVIDGDRNLSKN
jgi:hypothetical protein